MPAYKYSLKNGRTLWYAAFYYIDWTGKKKHCVKRGFRTQREAKEFENEFLGKNSNRSDIIFKNLVENYLADMANRLQPTTVENKKYIIDKKILPYFKDQKVCDIDNLKIRKWQDEMLSYRDESNQGFSQTYLRSLHQQMSAIMNYAVKHYGLPSNPCRIAGSIGRAKADEMSIWTQEQFEQFLSVIKTPTMHISFQILFWTGIREGELLALSPADLLETRELNIDKNYALVGGQGMILPPKTPKSRRKIAIPEFLYTELKDYISRLYGIQNDDRIFEFTKSALYHAMKIGAEKAGVPRIRIHDLRHSNASLLIHMGVDIMEVSRRLGHESTKTTWDTYGHLYPDESQKTAQRLDELRGKKDS